jgi:uncharacterized repeat protein (TIGR03837 family)
VWDIFCSVVDNYGDIGVTWRLARQLANDHGQQVRLWVDEPAAFAKLCPSSDRQLAKQRIGGVQVCHWPSTWRHEQPADVVIEAFACQLPAPYVAAMAEMARPPLWLNLEYLSAEDWVESCHALPSLQPNGLQKFFFFPGFTAATGGLLREQGLMERRGIFQSDDGVRLAFLQTLGVTPPRGARLISLFAYENAGLGDWLDAMVTGPEAICLLVPEGRVLGNLAHWLSAGPLAPGDCHCRGALTVQVLPFVTQDEYDRLLWCCDLNAVRGEDSFVRAQWAARPLLWHIYRQAEDAHIEKLQAFLQRYTAGLGDEPRQALELFHLAWNREAGMAEAWQALHPHLPRLAEHAESWCGQLTLLPDMATRLVHFYTDWL